MIEILQGPITAYKGFTRGDMTCHGFIYQPNHYYSIPESKVELCRRGFHACTNKNDVLKYYPRKTSIYYKVTLQGLIMRDTESTDSKIVASEIIIDKNPISI